MRKLISLALVCVLMLGWCAVPAASARTSAADGMGAYEADMLHLYRHFMDQPGGWEVLSNDSVFGYNHAVEELNGNRTFQIMLDATHFLTDSSWVDVLGGTYDVDDIKVQYYVTALSSLLMTMEENLADARAAQAEATSSLSWQEYLQKAGSAAAGVFSELASGEAVFQTAFSLCGIGIDTVGDTVNTLERYEVLTLNAETYLSYRTLLQTLKDHSTDPLLARAAGYLMDAVDRNFQYRMEHFLDFADIAVAAQSDQFFNVLDRVIDGLSPEELASGAWAALSILGKTAGKIGNFKLGVALGELAMDVFIGGSNLIQRYYEMAAMASAREALISVITEKSAAIEGIDDVSQIPEITELLTDLNYVNLRGAYCVYRINTTDGHLLSLLLKSKDAGAWFDTVKWICTQMGGLISRIVPDLSLYSNIPSTIELETWAEDGFEYGAVTAYDEAGDALWRYETPQCVMTELPAVAAIGQIGDAYYFVEDTSVVCLDAQSGAVLWKNDDYAGRASGIAYDENAIYLCGFYGPDFYAISYDGETLARIEQFDPAYYWAEEIELQGGQAAVYLHGGTASYDDPVVFYVDLYTYAVTSALGEIAAEPSIDELRQLLNDYFASYPWANEDILSGTVSNGSWRNDTDALFELRIQTTSTERTHQANILVGTVSIDAGTLTGQINWNGGDQEAIDLNAPQ